MNEDITKAIKTINDLSDLPWVDANERWGSEGIKTPEVRLIADRKKVTRERKNRKTGEVEKFTKWTGGYKDWGWDLKRARGHFLKAISLKKFEKSMFHETRRSHLWTVWWTLRHNNNLNRPDGKVSGTTLYGVWIEEAWHAAIWSPVVALAVRDLLESNPDDPKAIEVARLINIQRERLNNRGADA